MKTIIGTAQNVSSSDIQDVLEAYTTNYQHDGALWYVSSQDKIPKTILNLLFEKYMEVKINPS